MPLVVLWPVGHLFGPGRILRHGWLRNWSTSKLHRGSEILIGIGILVVGLAILHPLGNWLAKRYPEPELADSDESPESAEQSSPSS
jgi:hypothetical protein